MSTGDRTYTGAELRDLRRAKGLKGYELAARMGVHSSRVSQIEALATVSDDGARRYLAALGESPVASTPQVA